MFFVPTIGGATIPRWLKIRCKTGVVSIVWLCSDLRSDCGLILMFCIMGWRRWRCCIFSQLLPLMWHYYPLVVNTGIVSNARTLMCITGKEWPKPYFMVYFSLCKVGKNSHTRACNTQGLHWTLSHDADEWKMECVSVSVDLICPSQQHRQLFFQL